MGTPVRSPSRRRAAPALLAALLAALGVAAPSGAAAQRGAPAAPPAAAGPLARVRMGALVRPETVTVGDPFVVQVRVQAPADAQVTFAPGPDSTGAVEALEGVRVQRAPGTDLVDHTAIYRLAAWDVGAQPLRLGDAVVTLGDAERRVALAQLGVFVRSVLPADSALRVPKPQRPPLADLGPWWLRWLPWILAALALIGLLWWWWRRQRRPKPEPAVGTRAYGEALAAFARLDRMGLLEAGERGRYVALAVEILRDYLAARVPRAATSLTSSELLRALVGDAEIPHERLGTLLAGADLVKFAAAPVSEPDARRASAEARAIVDEVEGAVKAREEAAAREAAERARADEEARRRYEDERRRTQRKEAA